MHEARMRSKVVAVAAATIGFLVAAPAVFADAIYNPDTDGAIGTGFQLGGLIQVISGVVAIAFVVAGVVAVGRALAPSEPSASAPDGPRASSWRPRSRETGIAGIVGIIIAGVIGLLVGRAIAQAQATGGLDGIFGAALFAGAAMLLTIVLAVVAVVAFFAGHRRASWPIASVAIAAIMLPLAAFGARATAASTGGAQAPPVALEGVGRVDLRLDAASGVIPAGDGQATCISVLGGRSVVEVTAKGIGTIKGKRLTAQVFLPTDGTASGTADFFIDGADLEPGTPMVEWAGEVVLGELGADRRTGTMTLAGLSAASGALKPGEPPRETPSDGGAWPAALTGTMSWTCADWSDAAQP